MSDAETETIAFRMRLNPGAATEYKRRHDAIWPEFEAALADAGVVDYRIFLDDESGALFAVLTRSATHRMDALADQPVMRRWWAMMADIMQTEPDLSPTTRPLAEVFRFTPPH